MSNKARAKYHHLTQDHATQRRRQSLLCWTWSERHPRHQITWENIRAMCNSNWPLEGSSHPNNMFNQRLRSSSWFATRSRLWYDSCHWKVDIFYPWGKVWPVLLDTRRRVNESDQLREEGQRDAAVRGVDHCQRGLSLWLGQSCGHRLRVTEQIDKRICWEDQSSEWISDCPW